MHRARLLRKIPLAAAAALLALLGASGARAQTLSTDDGLSISLSASGAVESLKLAGVEYASAAIPSGFAYRELPSEPLDRGSERLVRVGLDGADRMVLDEQRQRHLDLGFLGRRDGVPIPARRRTGPDRKRSPMLTSAAIPIRPNTPTRFPAPFARGTSAPS